MFAISTAPSEGGNHELGSRNSVGAARRASGTDGATDGTRYEGATQAHDSRAVGVFRLRRAPIRRFQVAYATRRCLMFRMG